MQKRVYPDDFKHFHLTENFVEKFQNIKPNFGFNGLGEVVYMRSYSRTKKDGTNEKWWETVRRVVEGTYNMQKSWIIQNRLEWNEWKAQKSAQEMYERIFKMKFLPPGRGLSIMGSSITEERGLFSALNSCAFVSTDDIKHSLYKPFTFLFDASMLGLGTGFDTKGAGQIIIKKINCDKSKEKYIIPDTREGWVKSIEKLLQVYFTGSGDVEMDYSEIRLEGLPIKGFGGISSGSEPLKELHDNIRKVLNTIIGKELTSRAIVDIVNYIGKAVVSGNVRRSAFIAIGDSMDDDYLDLKNYDKNPSRAEFGWTSNNSVFADLGMDYTNVANRTWKNGEPGYIWLENIQNYSRIKNGKDNKDHRASGVNPCSEQSLESNEICNLVETFPMNHETLDDFKRTLKFAYLYAKTVTLGQTHWPETNRVMLRNRRIGCSISGIAQFLTYRGIHELQKWLEDGYDTIKNWDIIYSDWFAIPRSIKISSIKPSGSVSLLAGATPGVHYPESRFYIRRVRIAKNSPLIKPIKKAGYYIEDAIGDDSTAVVEFPIDVGEGIRTINEVSMWEQLLLVAFLQKHWADNQVSASIVFDPKKEGNQIVNALNYFQYQLKGISFLPKLNGGVFPQMPYEEIDEEKYKKMCKKLKQINFSSVKDSEVIIETFCNNDKCTI